MVHALDYNQGLKNNNAVLNRRKDWNPFHFKVSGERVLRLRLHFVWKAFSEDVNDSKRRLNTDKTITAIILNKWSVYLMFDRPIKSEYKQQNKMFQNP